MTEDSIAINAIPALSDNYIWAIIDPAKALAVVVDPGEAKPVLTYLAQHKLKLSAILVTHHHWDHTNGIAELIKTHHVPVYGPANSSISGISHPVREGNTVDLAPLPIIFNVLNIPGHTLDHIAYYADGMLFCGDTLFASGCGRVFEGTHEQMYHALQKLAALPDKTKIYCAHEYTENNLSFAKEAEPGNQAIDDYLVKVKEMRSNNQPSLPSTLSQEKQTNPFLRCHSQEIKRVVEAHGTQAISSDIDVFSYLRTWKDRF